VRKFESEVFLNLEKEREVLLKFKQEREGLRVVVLSKLREKIKKN
jgi:hypothetical protein